MNGLKLPCDLAAPVCDCSFLATESKARIRGWKTGAKMLLVL